MPQQRKIRHTRSRSELWDDEDLIDAFEQLKRRLGHRLRDRRLALGLTQEAAAEQTGIHVNQLQRIEVGRKNATLLVLLSLARAYDVQIGELFEKAKKEST